MNLLWKFWKDEYGAVISSELATVGSVVVIGGVAGLTEMRDSVTSELMETGRAIQGLNQSYSVSGIQTPSALVAGHSFSDANVDKNRNQLANP